MSRAIERAWAADGIAVRALTPLSWLFAAGVALRNAAFDVGVARVHPLGLPSVSIGNLSVGGTGKTPVAAYVAAELAGLGHRPAILLRGYGADEPLVHQRLNPGAIVVADPDRVSGAARAKAAGATVLVLDDAFQHRRAARDLDVVLIAAEQGTAHRMLPAGPLREGRAALRRAQGVIVTRKSASRDEAERVATAWCGQGERPWTVLAALVPGPLRAVDGSADERPLTALSGQRVLALSAIGNPAAYLAQLRALAAEVTALTFPDHHAFSAADITKALRSASSVGYVVCTLKDAVKLAGLWPREAPRLWYLSQAVEVEHGAATLHEALRRLGPDASR